jgi:hypothetical protein
MRCYLNKITAVLLLLLFLEKAGLRLLLHTQFHEYATADTKSRNDLAHAFLYPQGCDCLDDFFLPLTLSEEVHVDIPAPNYCDRYSIQDTSTICSIACLSSFLRGPPAFA